MVLAGLAGCWADPNIRIEVERLRDHPGAQARDLNVEVCAPMECVPGEPCPAECVRGDTGQHVFERADQESEHVLIYVDNEVTRVDLVFVELDEGRRATAANIDVAGPTVVCRVELAAPCPNTNPPAPCEALPAFSACSCDGIPCLQP